ncbi:MAG: YciI family protein [Gemmobacter sp.]|nr:YciI family protein [Gemmobacter sp.]
MLFACPSIYKKPVEPDVLDAHRVWLKQAIADGVIVSAGRRDPAIGGLIILRAENQAAAQAILAADPFTQQGVADYDTLGFNPTVGDIKG